MKYQIISICLICALKITGQESALLDTNDVSARIYLEGSLFNGVFEVPKGSHRNTIYSANLWIGAYDEFNQLHTAAQTYYSNQFIQDFFFGPVANDYKDSNYIKKFKRVWKVSRSIINYHKANFSRPGYVVPVSIADWPGNGNAMNGEPDLLAPFVDVNMNDIYDPVNGDYPDIRGDQAIYFIANDAKNVHTNSGGEPLGIEIHGMAYSFVTNADTALNQCVFVNYQIINRSLSDYHNLFIGMLSDMEIGDYFNDAIGCDSLLNLTYAYNGESIDAKYGNNPPAQGLILLNHSQSSFMYYINPSIGDPSPATTDPGTSIEYYRYLTNKWKNGIPLTRGNFGYNPGSTDTSKFAFNGDPNGTGWLDPLIHNEKNGISILGPFSFKSGASVCMDIAFPYARDYKGSNFSSVSVLKDRAQTIQTFYNMQGYNCPVLTTSIHQTNNDGNSILVYPNPGHGIFTLGHGPDQLSKNAKIEIYNAFAQKIYQTSYPQVEKTNIDISSQPGGIYFVKIFDGKKWTSKKLIIQ
jgi:hypothetical protein